MSPHNVYSEFSLQSLEKYRVSGNGFLPATDPLRCLPNDYYEPWEVIINDLPRLLESNELRHCVENLPILSTSKLGKEREWQRAYVILSFLAHGYIWGGDAPSAVLPPAITVPFLDVSSRLQLPPVATYAGLALWNWRPKNADSNITEPENLESLHTLTGTPDEEWFYLVSVAMEARAAAIIPIMLRVAKAAEIDDPSQMIPGLYEFGSRLKEVAVLLERMDERCSPQVFYHLIRPYLAGSMNMEAAGLPKGVFYDEGNGHGEWRKYRGGSNAQSSLIQFWDIMLGVEHDMSGRERYHQEMRSYMPGPHAAFLEDMAVTTNIRPYVEQNSTNTALRDAFNDAVENMKQFRNKHIQLVARYIIIPSKMPYAGKRVNLAAASSTQASTSSKKASQGPVLHGTGGTQLIPFLSQTRDETNNAKVTV